MNWIPINTDDLKAAGHGAIVDRAQTLATGGVEPVADAIASAVARIRRAVSAANALDADSTRVPTSLKAVTVRMALYALMERIGLSLSDDQRRTRELDSSDLTQLAERKILVEPPDSLATDLTPQNRGAWNSEHKLIGRTHPVPAPARQSSTAGAYANPEGPTDSTQ
jgi:hypothetical protein